MPDWFYRTVAQPCLFQLPDNMGRALAAGTIGLLGRSAPGRAVIDFLGHMRPPAALAVRRAGLAFPSPVGLGRRLDPMALALDGFARFGVGFLEIGPVGPAGETGPQPKLTRTPDRTLRQAPDPVAAGTEWWRERLARRHTRSVPLFARLQNVGAAGGLRDLVDGFIIEASASEPVPPPIAGSPTLLALDLDTPDPEALLRTAHAAGYAGAVLDAERPAADGGRAIGLTDDTALATLHREVRIARDVFGPDGLVIVTQAVRQPADARRWLEAGADLVQVDTGLLFTGPGLCKRCNEALATNLPSTEPIPPAREGTRLAWFWAFALGLAMAAGGALVLGVALTHVVLPYDEHYLGLSRDMLRAFSPRLLDFMTHDRVTLAGTMLGIGTLYATLAWTGVRRGAHWAQVAIGASGLTGFLSFFSFLGFGYFDPLHAFVSASLLPLTLLGLALPRGGAAPEARLAEWTEDGAWRRAQWGQLLLVVHAAGLLAAGLIILTIGMTDVFVAEDLAFLCLAPEQLAGLNERLIPVVAHDRASLGGMLLANGVGLLLATLWGLRRGSRHVWWAFLGTGLPAYVAAIGVHLYVGYTDWRHLLPAGVGAGLFAGGLLLTRGHAGARD